MIKLVSVSELKQQGMIALEKDNHRLLLIYDKPDIFLIENKCGHFGVPLQDSPVENKTITCNQHSIRFSLETGEILNRAWENCDPITTLEHKVIDSDVYWVKTV